MKKDRTLEIQYYDWRLVAWFTSETRDRLDDSGRGIYRELLDHCYAQGTFPDDMDWICRKCASTPKKLAAAWAIIEKHFPLNSKKRWRHNVLADIFRKRTFDYLEKQSEKRNAAVAKSKQEKVLDEVAPSKPQASLEQATSLYNARARYEINEGNEYNEGNEINERNEGTSTNGAAAAPAMQTEFPHIIAEIRKHDAAVDETFVRALVNRTVQYCISHPKFPPEMLVHINDKNIARCCAESYKTGPPSHRTGLLLSRVPPIAVTWSLED